MFTSYSKVDCLLSEMVQSGPDRKDRPRNAWSLSFMPDQDTAPLFPYINGAMEDALWYEHPGHVRFTLDGIRCVLHPLRWAAHFFESHDAAMAFIPKVLKAIRRIHEQRDEIRPNFSQIQRVNIPDLIALLPRTNCGDCGFPTCMAFAAALSRGKAAAHQCTGLARPLNETAVYPVFNQNGDLTHSLRLTIDTRELKNKIREQSARIRMLEDQLKSSERDTAAPPDRESGLTPREIEVLAHIGDGLTNNEIGNLLFISPHTVKSHMINIFNKLNVSDRTQAAVLAVRQGLI